MKSNKHLDQAIDWIRARGYSKIKSLHDNHENPSGLTQQGGDIEILPTATAYKHGGKSFFILVQKADDIQTLKSKWKLLATMARIKGGQFFLMVPRGTKAFAERIMQSSKITAHIVAI